MVVLKVSNNVLQNELASVRNVFFSSILKGSRQKMQTMLNQKIKILQNIITHTSNKILLGKKITS